MSALERAYADGQLAARFALKLAWPAATHPVVRSSPVLRSTPGQPAAVAPQRATPQSLSQQFDATEQVETRTEPLRKLSAASLCTSCRKDKHYGPCKRPIPIPIKRADFNMGMRGEDQSGSSSPSTSPHYSSATTSIPSLSRAQEGPPPIVQANAAFGRMPREHEFADQAAQSVAGLDKVSGERRGPSVDPYAERPPRGVPPAGGVGTDVDRAWRSFDTVVDSTCVDGGAGTPAGGPVA